MPTARFLGGSCGSCASNHSSTDLRDGYQLTDISFMLSTEVACFRKAHASSWFFDAFRISQACPPPVVTRLPVLPLPLGLTDRSHWKLATRTFGTLETGSIR